MRCIWLSTLVVCGACVPPNASGADAGLDGAAGRLVDGGPGGDGGPPDASTQLDGGTDAGGIDAGPLRVVLFSKTQGFRHDSIGAARAALTALDAGWASRSTESSSELTQWLAATDVVVFLLTSGDVLSTSEERVFEAFINRGGGWVGIHSAADTEYHWPFYESLVGAWFLQHPAIASGTLSHDGGVAVNHLPSRWPRTDEWYDFRRNPREVATVELTIDERTYQGGVMGADHPLAWRRTLDGGGRAYTTAVGHTAESWAEPLLLEHVRRAIDWAGRR
jgi:type 1 glutamine amidotransferase